MVKSNFWSLFIRMKYEIECLYKDTLKVKKNKNNELRLHFTDLFTF